MNTAHRHSIVRSIGIACIPLAVITGPAAIPALMTALLIASFGWTIWDVRSETIPQQFLPNRFRGRVTGTMLFLTGSSLALGALAGAGLVAATSIRQAPNRGQRRQTKSRR